MPRIKLTALPHQHCLQAKFEIITPMFLGDANQKATSIRPTSIKGALRFWWRAINAHLSLDELAKQEAKLFGTAEQNIGQGCFSINVTHLNLKAGSIGVNEREPAAGVVKYSAQHYLLGQGLTSVRNAFESGTFTVELLFMPKADKKAIEQIETALLAFACLGSLGSRARHGWGSIALVDLSGNQFIKMPKTKEEYRQALTMLSKDKINGLPQYTAFSSQTRIDIVQSGGNVQNLLNLAGQQLQLYRSFGNNGKVGKINAERNFTEDHDLIRDHLTGTPATKAPKRVIFGLPHNYFFSSVSSNNKAEIHAYAGSEKTRRTSPLFTLIRKIGNQFYLLHALFPAVFLPDQMEIRFKDGHRKLNFAPDYKVIEDYLNRPAFKDAERVLP
ncbi:type III-B CRISPR module RAMP protein Cmr1 [Thiomicrospira sp. R3]|uniref:type III-B CRISPR module RAMP protein Cmr1 n=1 Tax=Thiomicrospira sp. R3 TaxID=3035472 RepID=UPI00259B6428|nr:type III-B CRISPR module RAMP protein Cmr1 [Thiomicrospira sp. R3]WFE68512.1 type III-B CRISPR module RAMP protein Cmr1 [Thiomicrospira sp. R3]